MRPQAGVAPVNATDAVRYQDLACRLLLQSAIPFVLGPSAYMQNNGVVIIGQRPASSGTVTFSATSGTGVTATFSAATLLGSASDVGRVLTVLDTTYKFFTVTGNSGSSTTVCQGTISGGTLSTVGAFANTALWLSAAPAGTTGYSIPLPRVVGNSYAYFPAGAISTGSAAGWYWTNWSSTTVGQAYNVPYSTGQPAIIASPTAFATTGPGAFAQTTVTYLAARIGTLPANSGINASLETSMYFSTANSTGNKIIRCYIGSVATRYGQLGTTSYPGGGGLVSLTNQGVANAQSYTIGSSNNGGDFSGSASTLTATLAVDTTTAQSIGDCVSLGVATDWTIFERISIKLYPTSP